MPGTVLNVKYLITSNLHNYTSTIKLASMRKLKIAIN